MTKQTETQVVARSAWVRPELRRVVAGSAEAAGGFGGDNGAFS